MGHLDTHPASVSGIRRKCADDELSKKPLKVFSMRDDGDVWDWRRDGL